MISIYVDEAYALDILSILYIKQHNSDIDRRNFIFLEECIICQIGANLFEKIKVSPEYKKLVSLNQSVYEMIDLIRKGNNIAANIVDDANMERYNVKKLLQQQFFSKQLTENKY